MYQSYKLIFSVLRISLAPAGFVVHPLNSVISIFKLPFHHLDCATKGKRHFYGWIRHPNLPVATDISQTLESISLGVSNLNCVRCAEIWCFSSTALEILESHQEELWIIYIIPRKSREGLETCIFTFNLVLTRVIIYTAENKCGLYCVDLMAELWYDFFFLFWRGGCVLFFVCKQQKVAEV